MSVQESHINTADQQHLDYTMPSAQTDYSTTQFQFDPSQNPNMSFATDPSQQTFADGSIMWGGMQQLSLDKAIAQRWPQGLDQNTFGQQGSMTHIGQYGQITPPNDDSPALGSLKEEDDTSGPGQPQGAPPALSTRSKRGSSSRKPRDRDQQLSEKQRKTTRKARKGYKAMTKEEEENDSDGQMKRERFLERNRVAASKCREKKKVWTNGLEAHARDLAAANAHLNACALSLKEEVLYLKSECLRHAECDCSRIREYLDRSIAGMNPSTCAGGMLGVVAERGAAAGEVSGSGAEASTDAASVTDQSWRGSLSAEPFTPAGGGVGEEQVMTDREMQTLLDASLATPDSGMEEAS